MRVELLLMAAVFLPTIGLCAETSPQLTVGDLSKVQSDTILYDAKAKRAEAKIKMQENLAKSGDEFQPGQPATPFPVAAADLPTVTGISGAAGRLFATFQYPNGTTVSSKSGERIPGGYLVAEVGIDRVVLTKGDRRIPLQFGVAAVSPAAQSTSGPILIPSLPGTGSPMR